MTLFDYLNFLAVAERRQALLPYAQSVIRADQAFAEVVRGLTGLSSGRVKLGTCSSTCINWIPGILKSFRALHPGITVEVVSGFCNFQLTAKLRAIGAASPSPSRSTWASAPVPRSRPWTTPALSPLPRAGWAFASWGDSCSSR